MRNANEGHKLNEYTSTKQEEKYCRIESPGEDYNDILQHEKGKRCAIRKINIQKHEKGKEYGAEISKIIERGSRVQAQKDINVSYEKMDALKLDYESRWKE
jgi:hypothetical protein